MATEVTIPDSFDTVTRREKQVSIDGKTHWLREADSDTSAKYKSKCIRGAKFQEGKPTTVEDLGEVEPWLVSRCLWTKNKDGADVQVDEKVVRGWPNRVTAPMFDWIKANSDLENKKDTVDSLTADILRLQEKLATLREMENKGETREGN